MRFTQSEGVHVTKCHAPDEAHLSGPAVAPLCPYATRRTRVTKSPRHHTIDRVPSDPCAGMTTTVGRAKGMVTGLPVRAQERVLHSGAMDQA